ncbi:MAG: hypothetical protein AAGG01_15965 [Planctomycetota bacterium]
MLALQAHGVETASLPPCAPQQPVADSAPEFVAELAAVLKGPIAIGITATDRSLQDEELRRFAQILARRSLGDLEIASAPDYDPQATAAARSRSTLVAFDRWGRDQEALAHAAGVDAMFVVTSASARNGKKTKKKYVSVDKTKGDQKPVKVEVTSLLYKYEVEVLVPAAGPDSPATAGWERVSKIRSEGERGFAPMFLSKDTKKVGWDLAEVVAEGVYGSVGQARKKLASEWPESLNAETLGPAYAALGEGKRVLFWSRASLASPVKIGLPAEALIDLAFVAWERSDDEGGAAAVRSAAQAFLSSWLRDCVNGWAYRWRPAWLIEALKGRGTLRAESLEETVELVDELLEGFRHRPPMGVRDRRMPGVVVVAPDDIGLAEFALAAPDPAAFYRASAIYTGEDLKELKKSKSRWLKPYKGVQVLRLGSKPKALLKQSSKKLDPRPVLELLMGFQEKRWPGEPD